MIPKLELYKERWGIESDRSIKPGLESMTQALEILKSPQQRLQYIHFAGTNGKGSTLTFVEAIAKEHGLKVGKFTSPCIVDIHDQLQINGENITAAQLDAIFQQFKEAGISGKLTDFELLTCAAFVHFAKEQVDLVLLEAGMGGRFDSTNVITPLVSVIPSIALEHTNFLGNTLEQIAYHKAGIVKSGKDVVCGQLPKEAMDVLREEAAKLEAPLHCYEENFAVTGAYGEEAYCYEGLGVEIKPLVRQMLGNHQASNMALAITAFLLAAKQLKLQVQEDAVKAAVATAQIPGRFEQVRKNIYFDGAHNPASIAALCATLRQFSHKKIHILLGMLADKDVEEVLRLLEPLASKLSFIDVPNDRAMPAGKLLELSSHAHKQIVTDPVHFLQKHLAEDEMIVVTGSLYLLANIRAKLLQCEI